MAGLRFPYRRLSRLFYSTAFRLCSICLLLFISIQWIVHSQPDSAASSVRPRPTARVTSRWIDWSKLYYVQHVTTPEELCSSLMIWSEIEEIGSRAQRLMLYPSNWDIYEKDANGLNDVARMLQQARDRYYVKLRPLDSLVLDTNGVNIWSGSYTNLLGFNLTEFKRVVIIATGSVVKYNLDELFLLPAAPISMPYIYWGEREGWQFSTQLMVITPSKASFSKITDVLKKGQLPEYDTSILESLFYGKIIKIPQRPFALLPGEYRRKSHNNYLGKRWPRTWDADNILREARIVYFSDNPIPKPWIKASQDMLNRNMPLCQPTEGFGASNCRDRQVWHKLYADYEEKRQSLCGKDFAPVLNEHGRVDVGNGVGRAFQTI